MVDSEGYIWILDGKDCKIKKYDKLGLFLKSLGQKGRGPGEFIFPLSLFVSVDSIYITDLMLRKLIIMKKNGELFAEYKIGNCRAVKTGKNDEIVISGIRINNKITSSKKINGSCLHVYNKNGIFSRSFFPISNSAIRLKLRCRGVYFDLDDENNIYAVQETDYTIHKYNMLGELIKTFSKRGQHYNPPPSKPLEKIYLRSQADKWIKSWTHINKIEVLNNGLLLVNLLTFSPEMYAIDVYDIDGNSVHQNVITNKRLLCADENNNLYFLEEEVSQDISRKILKCKIGISSN